MERGKAEKAKTLKSLKNLRKINDFGLLGPSWEASWRLLGASWRPLGPLLGRLGQSWEGLVEVLEVSGVVFGGLGGVHARRPGFYMNFTHFRKDF